MDMDYVDPEDEFELMYGDQMEMLREMEEEAENGNYSKPKSKRSLDFDQPSTSTGGFTTSNKPKNVEKEDLGEPLFPELGQKTLPESNSLECLPLNTYKRSVSELFGDIADLEDVGFENSLKRRRLEEEKSKEERQDFLIEMIKNQRKNLSEERSFNQNLNYSRNEKEVEDCMSVRVPSWPFVAVSTNNAKLIYLRFRTEDSYSQVQTSKFRMKTMGLLDLPYDVLKEAAMKERQKKFENTLKVEDFQVPNVEKDLWVERYKPKIYLELLSDESTNRSLLQWLKLWDKIVFKRDPPVLKKMDKFEKKNVLDEHGRPINKVALLCGPPGLGKTTLAHMIARQAGYNMVEVNASDDRSAQVFKVQLEAATQMKSVMGSDPKPNCLILDEIDGAPQAAIDFLVKFVTEKLDRKKKKKGGGILKRPIICICNDIYVPALRPLRQIAFNIAFPSISSARLGERLVEISRAEKILTDLGTMMALSEKTNNDIRSCLSVLHCLKSKSGKVSLGQVQAANIGIKDVQQGLFSVWQAIFHIRLKRKASDKKDDHTLNKRLQNVLRSVQSFGDYDRLSMGVFENYLLIRPKDSSLKPIVESLKWFQYFDLTSQNVHSTQNYTLYPYLPFPFVAWHFLLATAHWPKLQYPSAAYEFNQRHVRFKHILDFSLSGMPAYLQAYQHKENLLLDTIPYLIHLIIPSLRPVSVQLYSQKERAELNRVVNIMADYNLNYTQERTLEGNYVFNLDPNIEDIGFFGERPRERIFGHAGKQMVLKEVEAEKLRRAQAKCGQLYELKIPETNHSMDVEKEVKQSSPVVPNHLQKLTPKNLKKKVEMQAKDFFGRVVEKNLNKIKDKAKTDDIVKSEIWFHFKEGYNNAVRKNVYISDLI